MRIGVTGATGFVGQRTIAAAAASGVQVRAICRSAARSHDLPARVDVVESGDLHSATRWAGLLDGLDAVIHLAARVHVMDDRVPDPLAAFREVNVAGTVKLARAAAAAGVRRFVFVSSIKVNGEQTSAEPFTEADLPAPVDPYGVSKWEAEQALQEVAASTGLEVVVLRPPLVYGPGVGANFLRLLEAVARRTPLPLGCVNNRRSLVFVGNFADAILRASAEPLAAGETFLVSDGPALSTPELIRRIAASLGVRPRLLPVPVSMLTTAGRLTGRGPQIQRLVGSLEVSNASICERLGWKPPFTVDQALQETAEWWTTSKAQ